MHVNRPSRRSTALPQKFAARLPAGTAEHIGTACASEVHFCCTIGSFLKLSNENHIAATIVTGGSLVSLDPRRFTSNMSQDLTRLAIVLSSPQLPGIFIILGIDNFHSRAIAGVAHSNAGFRRLVAQNNAQFWRLGKLAMAIDRDDEYTISPPSASHSQHTPGSF